MPAMNETRRWPAGLAQDALGVAWALSCVALLGSLYFSEVRGWQPGTLCWYQRISLWPLVLILGQAWFRKRPDVAAFVLPQVAAGTSVAVYQVLTQQVWRADGAVPTCMVNAEIGLGPVTIPLLSLAAHLAIGASLLVAWRRGAKRNADETTRRGVVVSAASAV